eukprot:scaffold57409_cov32-Tisochrysis_lutea.AAC.3
MHHVPRAILGHIPSFLLWQWLPSMKIRHNSWAILLALGTTHYAISTFPASPFPFAAIGAQRLRIHPGRAPNLNSPPITPSHHTKTRGHDASGPWANRGGQCSSDVNGQLPMPVRPIHRDGPRVQRARHPLDERWGGTVLLAIRIWVGTISASVRTVRVCLVLEPTLARRVVPHVIAPAKPALGVRSWTVDKNIARLCCVRAELVGRHVLGTTLSNGMAFPRAVKVNPPAGTRHACCRVRLACFAALLG